MKYLILFLVIITLPLFAQDKQDNDKKAVQIQANKWMTKISSDPELRLSMMTMILDETKGNKEEMSKLGKTILDNPDINSIMASMIERKTNSENMSAPSRSMMGDRSNAKTMELSGHKSYQKK